MFVFLDANGNIVNDYYKNQREKSYLTDPVVEFENLINPIKNQISKCLWRILQNHEAVEDAHQETLTAVWKNFSKVKVHNNPEALILKICINKAYDKLRKKKSRTREITTENYNLLNPQIQENSLNNLENEEIREELMVAISRLSKKQASAIYMRLVEEYPYPVIADLMDCSEGTVRNHVRRGRIKLVRWLSHLANQETIS